MKKKREIREIGNIVNIMNISEHSNVDNAFFFGNDQKKKKLKNENGKGIVDH